MPQRRRFGVRVSQLSTEALANAGHTVGPLLSNSGTRLAPAASQASYVASTPMRWGQRGIHIDPTWRTATDFIRAVFAVELRGASGPRGICPLALQRNLETLRSQGYPLTPDVVDIASQAFAQSNHTRALLELLSDAVLQDSIEPLPSTWVRVLQRLAGGTSKLAYLRAMYYVRKFTQLRVGHGISVSILRYCAKRPQPRLPAALQAIECILGSGAHPRAGDWALAFHCCDSALDFQRLSQEMQKRGAGLGEVLSHPSALAAYTESCMWQEGGMARAIELVGERAVAEVGPHGDAQVLALLRVFSTTSCPACPEGLLAAIKMRGSRLSPQDRQMWVEFFIKGSAGRSRAVGDVYHTLAGEAFRDMRFFGTATRSTVAAMITMQEALGESSQYLRDFAKTARLRLPARLRDRTNEQV